MKNQCILNTTAEPMSSTRESYSTGFQIVDGQHQRMLELLNQVRTDIEQYADIEIVRIHYFYFEEFSRSHIIDEEQLILRKGGQISFAHAKDHEHLLDMVSEIRLDHIDLNNRQLAIKLETLFYWLQSHVTIYDKEDFELLTKKEYQYL